MSWNADLQPSGLFVISNAVGRPLFDGAFRPNIPGPMRMEVLTQITESPAMLVALGSALDGLSRLADALIAQAGGGAQGEFTARQEAPPLFALIEQLKDQIDRSVG